MRKKRRWAWPRRAKHIKQWRSVHPQSYDRQISQHPTSALLSRQVALDSSTSNQCTAQSSAGSRDINVQSVHSSAVSWLSRSQRPTSALLSHQLALTISMSNQCTPQLSAGSRDLNVQPVQAVSYVSHQVKVCCMYCGSCLLDDTTRNVNRYLFAYYAIRQFYLV